jgi:hypothetical protein
MDPLSATASSIAIITLCVQITRVLHSTIENYTNCPSELLSLLSSIEGLLIQLRRLDAVKPGLTDQHRQYLQEVCGDAWEERCRMTVEELNLLVWKVQTMGIGTGSTPPQRITSQHRQLGNGLGCEHSSVTVATPFLGRLAWVFKKDDATKLSRKLAEHREDIFRALCTITMWGGQPACMSFAN